MAGAGPGIELVEYEPLFYVTAPEEIFNISILISAYRVCLLLFYMVFLAFKPAQAMS